MRTLLSTVRGAFLGSRFPDRHAGLVSLPVTGSQQRHLTRVSGGRHAGEAEGGEGGSIRECWAWS